MTHRNKFQELTMPGVSIVSHPVLGPLLWILYFGALFILAPLCLLLIPLVIHFFTSFRLREKGSKERQELETKYAVHDAELLDEFNKHHG